MSGSKNDEKSYWNLNMEPQIHFCFLKKLKKREIEITCNGTFIENSSMLNKYYEKNVVEKACKYGCSNYKKKWSCPPFSRPCYEVINNYKSAILVCLSTDMKFYEDIGNKYTAIKAANSTLKSLIEKSARNIEELVEGYAFLSGSCRLCKPCALKNQQICKHPDRMRFSVEASFLNVQKMCEELLGFKLLWYSNKTLPKYTSTVILVLHNNKIEVEKIKNIIQDTVNDK